MGIAAEVFLKRLLVPSVLSADFSRLGEEVQAVLDGGVRLVHFDVMDGHFVPNLTIGPAVVSALAPRVHQAGAFVDVHLMVERPDMFLDDFIAAGADALSVHVETTPNLHRTLTRIRDLGATAGVVLNPATPVSAVEEAALVADYILVMSVNPGFGGQAFIPESLDKLRRLRAVIPPKVTLEVDGGVGLDNAARLVAAGADWLVAGSAVFTDGDPSVKAGVLQAVIDEAVASSPR